jgi:hypothetical protein
VRERAAQDGAGEQQVIGGQFGAGEGGGEGLAQGGGHHVLAETCEPPAGVWGVVGWGQDAGGGGSPEV